MKQKKFKRCPRCDSKVPFFEDRCNTCGLIFSRLKKATNKAAKMHIKSGEYNKIVMDSVLPKDVKKWKLFWLAVFFGFFGVHYAKVGRYKMFTWAIVSAAFIFIAALLPQSWLNHEYLSILMWSLILPASIYAIYNVISIFEILFNRFKVPIAIDENLVVEDLDKNIVNDILNKVKKEENTKKEKIKPKKITIVCSSCGRVVKVFDDETICPKCDEPLKEK